MTKRNLRLLVISDLHAIVDQKQRGDSRLVFENGVSEYGDAFIKFAKSLRKEVDVLICAGDVSNKADVDCFSVGWKFINKIKNELDIPNLLCVPGNHDHQSRSTIGVFDPKHHLQFISPPFPFSCQEKNTHFWAWHWCHSVIERSDLNIISLNSSAYHGFNDEYHHGRVATEISDQISEYIHSTKFRQRTINVLLCHHHPEKMEHVDREYDCEAMEGGPYLLRKIEEADKGPWLVIHGHKHFADIVYGRSTGSCAPTIFSAGSISAKLYSAINDRTSNQFYCIEIDVNETDKLGRLVGIFETYEWTMATGWQPSLSEQLPAKGGFGSTKSPGEVAMQIQALITDRNPFLNEADMARFSSITKNFTPGDFRRLVKKLKCSGFHVTLKYNEIVEVGRPHV